MFIKNKSNILNYFILIISINQQNIFSFNKNKMISSFLGLLANGYMMFSENAPEETKGTAVLGIIQNVQQIVECLSENNIEKNISNFLLINELKSLLLDKNFINSINMEIKKIITEQIDPKIVLPDPINV